MRARARRPRCADSRPLAVSANAMFSLHRLPRQQLVELLEDDDAVGAGRVDRRAVEQDAALDRRDEAGDRLEHRRLAAPGRSEDDEPIARVSTLKLTPAGRRHAR